MIPRPPTVLQFLTVLLVLCAAPVLAAEAATAQSEFLAGLASEYRSAAPPDYPEAARHYEAAAAAGSREALLALARLSVPGGPLNATPAQWRDRLLAASRAGWPLAACQLAEALEKNQVPADGLNAAGLYFQAAAAGHGPAARRLGELYLSGQGGLAPDQAQGLMWLTVAAENQDDAAALDLGRFYYAQDRTLAARWLRRSQNPEASYLLGRILLDEKSFTEALAAFAAAAERNYAPAHLALGILNLDNEFGRLSNPRAAIRHLKIAAQAELPEGAYHLARLYLTGQGTPKDSITAAFWLHQAASRGYAPAQTEYDKLVLTFSTGQKKRLDRMIEEGVAPTAHTPAQ